MHSSGDADHCYWVSAFLRGFLIFVIHFFAFPFFRLLAKLSSRLCESAVSAIVVPPTGDANTTAAAAAASSEGGVSVSAYLLDYVVGRTHLRDRLGMQRFVGSLLLAAWPPSAVGIAADALNAVNSDLSIRLNNCLTNVVYYEEILGAFKTMHEDCHRLRALCDATKLPFLTGLAKA